MKLDIINFILACLILTGYQHDQEDKIGVSQEQNTDKEEFDLGKCQGIICY